MITIERQPKVIKKNFLSTKFPVACELWYSKGFLCPLLEHKSRTLGNWSFDYSKSLTHRCDALLQTMSEMNLRCRCVKFLVLFHLSNCIGNCFHNSNMIRNEIDSVDFYSFMYVCQQIQICGCC